MTVDIPQQADDDVPNNTTCQVNGDRKEELANF
jgi:hypothetical protein